MLCCQVGTKLGLLCVFSSLFFFFSFFCNFSIILGGDPGIPRITPEWVRPRRAERQWAVAVAVTVAAAAAMAAGRMGCMRWHGNLEAAVNLPG
jgi:hypothetical protein